MSDVCYFLIGRVSQDIEEGSQECLLWKLRYPQNPFCKVVDEPSIILESNLYIFDGDKAKKKCICFEKDAIKALAIKRGFDRLYSK